MTHDPLFVARLVHHPETFRASVIYDFIPLEEPDRYLPTPTSWLDFHLAMYWLSQYDAFLSISHSAAAKLAELLSVPQDEVTVTGAPIDPRFESPTIQGQKPPGSYLLVIGGSDSRKNVECVIRAHGMSHVLQQRGVSLIVTGNYSKEWQSRLQVTRDAAGGKPELLILPGKIADDELVQLYGSAACVVVPSTAEGFSLPVVEAMAAGTPVIASRIAVHQELIASQELLFSPHDAVTVTRLAERVVEDQEFRLKILASQANGWQRFRAREVALSFWSALEPKIGALSPPTPVISRNRRPTLAVMSPVPPDRSGVADYTAASLRELGKLVDVHVFTETQTPARIDGAASISTLSDLPSLSTAFDRVLGVVGNSEFHLGIFNNLLRYGGACIEHDNRLLGFYGSLLGETRARRQAECELGRPLKPGELESWFADESLLKALFLKELADVCEPLCFHSKVTARLVLERYGKRAVYLPFSTYRELPPDALMSPQRTAARALLGISADEIAIASFGIIARTKGPEECIWALETLRSWGIPASLHFVGATSDDNAALKNLCCEIGVTPYVHFVGDRSAGGFVTEECYRLYLQAADLALQLRTFGFGGLSGALLDCIAAGLPGVANDDLAQAMEAPSYVRRVPDHLSPVLIAEAVAELVDRGMHRKRDSEERRAYNEVHNFQVYAHRLCAALGLEPPGARGPGNA
jgi:glycosyltransferase involved in cell wall biosynthesis